MPNRSSKGGSAESGKEKGKGSGKESGKEKGKESSKEKQQGKFASRPGPYEHPTDTKHAAPSLATLIPGTPHPVIDSLLAYLPHPVTPIRTFAYDGDRIPQTPPGSIFGRIQPNEDEPPTRAPPTDIDTTSERSPSGLTPPAYNRRVD
jgi:hypothetical protein